MDHCDTFPIELLAALVPGGNAVDTKGKTINHRIKSNSRINTFDKAAIATVISVNLMYRWWRHLNINEVLEKLLIGRGTIGNAYLAQGFSSLSGSSRFHAPYLPEACVVYFHRKRQRLSGLPRRI